MVSEQLTVEASTDDSAVPQVDLDFEIVDQTSTEQVAREEQLLSPEDSEGSTARDQHDEPAGAESDFESSPERNPESEHGAESVGQQARTYSQAEVSKMQSAWARQIEDARKAASRAGQELERFNIDAAVEAMLKQQEADLASEVGPERASQIARSPRNSAVVRKSLENQRLLQVSETERLNAIEQQENQARLIVAQSLAREHGVSADDFELLASASTPRAMQGLARRLGGNGTSVARDRVPPETEATQLENGYQAGPQPENAERRLDRIRSKPAWEWTDADLQYMKTGEVR